MEIPATARFCPQCGAQQVLSCDQCGSSVESTDRFCGDCGNQLQVKDAAPEPVRGAAQRTESENRSLTIMFCDLVESVQISSTLDAEELREMLREYYDLCGRSVTRFDGHLAQLLGDGVVSYFGWPHAHEGTALRTVLAAMDIIENIQSLASRWAARSGIDLRVRIGVHTGVVAVGELGNSEQVAPRALGEVPHIAAQLQTMAPHNGVAVSDQTHALVPGYFDFEKLPLTPLKGVDRKVQVYRVLKASSATSRLTAERGTQLLPFVGREHDLEQITALWKKAQAGHGQVVMLSGEAGIGKSRLVYTLRDNVGAVDAQFLEAQCSQYLQSTAFAPTIGFIERSFNIQREDPVAVRAQALRSNLSGWPSSDPEESMAVLASLLRIHADGEFRKLDLNPKQHRQKTIEILAELQRRRVAIKPAIVVFEDLHWADPSTLELLNKFVADAPASRVLLILTCRPEFKPPWLDHAGVTEISLQALSEPASRSLVAHKLASQALPPDVMLKLIERAEGNPLYLEEITQAVITADARLSGARISEHSIPHTLSESLLSRINQLGPEKSVAQIASVIGRSFSRKLLNMIAKLPEDVLDADLNRLVTEGIFLLEHSDSEMQVSFKHAMLRDAAYDTLLRSRRRSLHEKIAQTLLENFPELCEAQPELPARHFAEADQPEASITHWRLAAQSALAGSALAEAESHLNNALSLLRGMPASRERDEKDLELLMSLGPLQMATRGFSDSQVADTYQQARGLCKSIENAPRVVPVLAGLWAFHVVRGDLNLSHGLAEEILNINKADGNSGTELEGRLCLGVTLQYQGQHEAARTALQRALLVYDPKEHRDHVLSYGQEPGLASHTYMAVVSAHTGHSDQARQHLHQARLIAEQAEHAHSWARYLGQGLLVSHILGDAESVCRFSMEFEKRFANQDLPIWGPTHEIISKSWLSLEQEPEKIECMRRALAVWKSTGAVLNTSLWQCLLASAFSANGEHEEAIKNADAALELEFGGEERVNLCPIHFYRAEIKWHGHCGDPEPDIESTIRIAREQGARIWELKARVLWLKISMGDSNESVRREALQKLTETMRGDGPSHALQEASELLDPA